MAAAVAKATPYAHLYRRTYPSPIPRFVRDSSLTTASIALLRGTRNARIQIMDTTELHFIQATYAVELDGEPADAIELSDGRVVVIDGNRLTVFEDLESVLSFDDEDGDDRP
jgi:hypothetical protein